jgi:hypothetical protein
MFILYFMTDNSIDFNYSTIYNVDKINYAAQNKIQYLFSDNLDIILIKQYFL